MRVVLDLETRSRVDLESCGISVYAQHPSTEVLCMAYAVDAGPVELWLPSDAVPPVFSKTSTARFVAHNAGFESYLFRYVMSPRHGFPTIPPQRWECTAAKAAYANLPRKLSLVSKFLQLGDASKDDEGHKNMLRLCRPVGARLIDGIYHGGHFDDNFVWHEWERDYCMQDVTAERVVDSRLPDLPPREREIWLLDRKINDRGVPVDVSLCRGAAGILDEAFEQACQRVSQLTEGAATSPDESQKILTWLRGRGVELANIQASTVDEVLESGPTDAVAAEVLRIRQESTLASVKKFQAALQFTDSDGRCRDQMLYYGAGPGRWTGKGVQFQNLKRSSCSEEMLSIIAAGDYGELKSLGEPIPLLATAVRSMICAPAGRELVISDFASIEARVLHWLAGDEATLQKFRDGTDLYKDMASRIYGVPFDAVTKDQRQIGKIAVLGLGYGMGARKFVSQAKVMGGVEVSEQFAADVVSVYRSTNLEVSGLWRTVENAASVAIRTGKRVAISDTLAFQMQTDWLTLSLPSGRDLYYFRPAIERTSQGSRVTYLDKKSRQDTYGGKLVENIVQATARDLLADALLRIDRLGLFTVLHVHDEVVAEIRQGDERSAKLVHDVMETTEAWAAGLPVKAETLTSHRYTK